MALVPSNIRCPNAKQRPVESQSGTCNLHCQRGYPLCGGGSPFYSYKCLYSINLMAVSVSMSVILVPDLIVMCLPRLDGNNNWRMTGEPPRPFVAGEPP